MKLLTDTVKFSQFHKIFTKTSKVPKIICIAIQFIIILSLVKEDDLQVYGNDLVMEQIAPHQMLNIMTST
jgi:hypothetical protein